MGQGFGEFLYPLREKFLGHRDFESLVSVGEFQPSRRVAGIRFTRGLEPESSK